MRSRRERWTRRWREQIADGPTRLLAVHAGVPIGFVTCGPARHRDAPLPFELYAVYVRAAWHGTGAAKALFFSFVACALNWRAFLAYGAASAAVALGLPLAGMAALALFPGARVPVMALAFPLVMLLLPTFFASFYASYRDVFGGGEAGANGQGGAV